MLYSQLKCFLYFTDRDMCQTNFNVRRNVKCFDLLFINNVI